MDIPLFDASTMILVTFLFVFTTQKGWEMLTELGTNIVLRIPILRSFLREAIPVFVSVPCIVKALVAENERCGEECQEHRTETLSRFSTYVVDTTMDQEFKTGFFKLRTLWINWILLRKIHQAKQDDKLDLYDETQSTEKLQRFVHNFFARNDASLEYQAIELPKAFRLMKLTTAAYGSPMVNLVAASSNLSIASNPVKDDLDILRRHNELRTLRKSMVVVNRNGDWNYADHILIFNHEKKVSALTIRGTFSVADVLTDLDVTPVEFCGGVAPHGMVRMAMNVWEQIKDEALTRLAKENYLMCIKGHSLGGGIGMLLTMYLIHEKGISNIRCHTYGAPPVFSGNDDTLKEVSKYITAFVHQDDAIPFISPYHLRQLNASLTVVDRARQQLSWFQLIKAVLSSRPSPELTRAFLEQPPLEPIAIMAPMQWPAGRTVWLRKTDGRHYNAILCDSKRLGLERGLLLASTMLSDHLPAQYERALQDLVDRDVDVLHEGATASEACGRDPM